jgi:predicted esterase YcpF (UPF0227 family)
MYSDYAALGLQLEAALTGTYKAVQMAKESFDKLQATFDEVLAQKEALEKELAIAKRLVERATHFMDGRSAWTKNAKSFLEAPHEAK